MASGCWERRQQCPRCSETVTSPYCVSPSPSRSLTRALRLSLSSCFLVPEYFSPLLRPKQSHRSILDSHKHFFLLLLATAPGEITHLLSSPQLKTLSDECKSEKKKKKRKRMTSDAAGGRQKYRRSQRAVSLFICNREIRRLRWLNS